MQVSCVICLALASVPAARQTDHPHYDYDAPFQFNQFNTLSMLWKIHRVEQLRASHGAPVRDHVAGIKYRSPLCTSCQPQPSVLTRHARVAGPEFRTGMDFDAVIRIRPDLILHDKLNLDSLGLPRSREQNVFRGHSTVYLPWFNVGMRLAFDQFAVGTPSAMRAAAKAYFNVPYLVQSPHLKMGFHPEHVWYMHLVDSGLSLRNFGCKLSLARAARGTGCATLVDSFFRLRQEFGARLCMCATVPSRMTADHFLPRHTFA